jgi:hypothetical protein
LNRFGTTIFKEGNKQGCFSSGSHNGHHVQNCLPLHCRRCKKERSIRLLTGQLFWKKDCSVRVSFNWQNNIMVGTRAVNKILYPLVYTGGCSSAASWKK